MKYVGSGEVDFGGQKLSAVRNATDDNDAQNQGQAVRIVHQGGSRTARTIYVQLSAESDPSTPATGDIRILEA